MASEYWKQIKTEIDNFDLVEPEFNPNFAPTQSSLINLIDSYWFLSLEMVLPILLDIKRYPATLF